MTKLKIVKIVANDYPSYYGTCKFVEVGFEISDPDPNFGYLGEFYRGVVVPDIEAYNKNYEDTIEKITQDRAAGEDNFLKYLNEDSPYDRGLCKIDNIVGSDSIKKFPDQPGYFEYGQYVADCPITRACIEQLFTMKKQIDEGVCAFGDFPDQVGCFRSGDVVSDFVGIIECLDRFWD